MDSLVSYNHDNLLRVITWSNPIGNLAQIEGSKPSDDANEPTAPYIIGRILNLKETCSLRAEPATVRTAVIDVDRD